ncbi:MAG: ABC transporter substrate-binding protein, partial [Eubacterium sp.]|nr:ABC transporter substrate-binding protein [Eubacterium sp.]
MKKHLFKKAMAMVLAAGMTLSVAACGGGGANLNTGEMQEVDAESLKFPLAETATIKGLISYPANTESNPNN